MLTNYANENNASWLRNTTKAVCFGGLLMGAATTAHALTADDVLNKMSSDQRSGYLAGVVGGLAYARWLDEKPSKTGMNCIHDWLYGDDSETALKRVNTWFSKHLDKPAAPLLYILIKKECGE